MSHTSNYFLRLMRLSEVVGISYFNRPGTGLQHLRKLYPYIIILLFIIGCILMTPLFEMWFIKDASIFLPLKIGVRFVSVFVILLTQILNNKKINKVVEKCIHFSVKTDNSDPLDGYTKISTVLYFLIFILYAIQFFLFQLNYPENPWLATLFYAVLSFLYIAWPSNQFILIVKALKQYFIKLNQQFNYSMNQASTALREVALFRQKHLQLVEIAAYVTSTYSVQILILMTVSYTELLLHLNNVFTSFITGSNGHSNVLSFISNSYIILVLILNIFYLVRCCEETIKESKQTTLLVCVAANQTNDLKMKSELGLFLFQKIITDVKFPILGMFSMDYKFLYSVISNLTAYSLILAMYLFTLYNYNKNM